MSTSQYTTLIHTSGHPALKPFPGFKMDSPPVMSPLSPPAILALQQPSPPQVSNPIYIETSSSHFSSHSPLMTEIKSEPMSSYSPSSSPSGPILSNGRQADRQHPPAPFNTLVILSTPTTSRLRAVISKGHGKGRKRNFVSSVVTVPPAITTTRLPAKAARVSSGEASLRARVRSICANMVTTVKLTCTCGESVKRADSKSVTRSA